MVEVPPPRLVVESGPVSYVPDAPRRVVAAARAEPRKVRRHAREPRPAAVKAPAKPPLVIDYDGATP